MVTAHERISYKGSRSEQHPVLAELSNITWRVKALGGKHTNNTAKFLGEKHLDASMGIPLLLRLRFRIGNWERHQKTGAQKNLHPKSIAASEKLKLPYCSMSWCVIQSKWTFWAAIFFCSILKIENENSIGCVMPIGTSISFLVETRKISNTSIFEESEYQIA